MKTLIAFILFISLLLGIAVAAEDLKEEYSDPARTIEVAVGKEFAIVLESNPTTGYRWQIAGQLAEDIIKPVGNEYRGPKTMLVGAGGIEVWTFRATGKGDAEIGMEYVRPWEKDVVPAKTLTFRVIVGQPI